MDVHSNVHLIRSNNFSVIPEIKGLAKEFKRVESSLEAALRAWIASILVRVPPESSLPIGLLQGLAISGAIRNLQRLIVWSQHRCSWLRLRRPWSLRIGVPRNVWAGQVVRALSPHWPQLTHTTNEELQLLHCPLPGIQRQLQACRAESWKSAQHGLDPLIGCRGWLCFR